MIAYPQGSRSAFKLSVLVAGFLTTASALFATVTASITPSRSSGVAPLAVNFDATGTTSTATTRPFHDVYYTWNYGDSGSGTWSTDGKSKNHDSSAIGGHVYETPGTYTVTLIAKDSTGATDTKTATITVTDPATVFSGTSTVCISTTADFTGAPAGALQVTTTSWSTVVGHLGTGKRVLLHRGQSWNHNSAKKDLTFNGPGILGAFGSGARPIIRLVSTDVSNGGRVFWFGTGSTANQFNDFRFMDLEIDGAGFDRGFAWSEGSCQNITLLRLYMHHGGQLLFLSPDIYTYYNSQADVSKHGHTLPAGIAIVDTQYQTMIGDGTEFNKHHIAYVGMHRALMLGNVWNNTEAGEHIFRLPFVQRTLIAHNELTNTRSTKHLIKLHAQEGLASLVTPAGNGQSKYVTIADNYLTSAKGNWLVSTGPQNTTSNEVVQDIVIERNDVHFGGESTTAFDLRGSNHTVRNNTVIMTGSPFAGTVAVFAPRGIEPPPDNNRVYNNSAFRSDTPGFVFVNAAGTATNTSMYNNLASAPNASSATLTSGSGTITQSNNLITNAPGWVAASPTTALQFDLASTSSSIDAGATVPVFDDFEEAPRPQGSARDRGAFEYIPATLLSYGSFEPNQATVLGDQTEPYTLGTGPLGIWQGRLGTGVQQTTYQTSGSNHYVTIGTSVNTNGAFQVITWPGAGTRTVSFQYRGTGSFVKIFGGNTGNTINKFNSGNTLTLITQINNPAASAWTSNTQTVTLTGSYNYLVIQLRAGDFDDVSITP
jgi:hypothetical protein